jgi:hypothetical protein
MTTINAGSAERSWFDPSTGSGLTMSGCSVPFDFSLILSLSSLDWARDDPELAEGSKDEQQVRRLTS